MFVPSRLKLYPVGITRPTTGLDAPRPSIFSIICGSTVSEEEVPSTISSSSLMYTMKRRMEKPVKRAIDPMPPARIVPALADEGFYLASEASFHRVLRDHGQINRRARARPP